MRKTLRKYFHLMDKTGSGGLGPEEFAGFLTTIGMELSDKEKLNRDRWEEKTIAAGKDLPYRRSPEQAEKAKKNVAANPAPPKRSASQGSGKGGGRSGRKGGGKGGGGDQKCWHVMAGNPCPHGEKCRFRSTTPNHP